MQAPRRHVHHPPNAARPSNALASILPRQLQRVEPLHLPPKLLHPAPVPRAPQRCCPPPRETQDILHRREDALDGVLAHVRKADALPASEVPVLSVKDGEGNAEGEEVFGGGLVGVGRYAEGRV